MSKVYHAIGRIFAAALFVFAGGCAGNPFADAVNSIQTDDDIEMFTRNPELDVVVFKSPDDVEKFCMSPETDAVPTASVGFAFSYSTTASASEESGLGAGALGGRSAAVLIAREILYRTCEVTLNYDLSKDEALTLFNTALEKVQSIAESDAAAGSGTASFENDTAGSN